MGYCEERLGTVSCKAPKQHSTSGFDHQLVPLLLPLHCLQLLPLLLIFYFFKQGLMAQARLEPRIFLPPPLECEDYRQDYHA